MIGRIAAIPQHLQVGPFTYEVAVDQARIDRAGHEAHTEYAGLSNHERLTIVLMQGLAVEVERETLLHEVLHCVVNAAGRPSSRGPLEQEEWVLAASPGLLDTLLRNPQLIAYLLGHEEPD